MQGRLLLAYRYQPGDGASRIALCELKDLVPQTSQMLELPEEGGLHHEDPRLFWHAGSPWLAYTEAKGYPGPWTCCMRLARLQQGQDGVWRAVQFTPLTFRYNGQIGQEKNWQFFSHEGGLFFVYRISPHEVVQIDPDSGKVLKHYETPGVRGWSHGTLSGGTPPLLIGDSYVSVFHSFEPHVTRGRRYSASVYRFEPEPPFAIRELTTPILWGSEADGFCPDPRALHNNPCVVFPAGAIQWQSRTLLVSSGINDHACALSLIDLDRLEFHAPVFPTPWRYFKTDRAAIPVVIAREVRATWVRTGFVAGEWQGAMQCDDPNLIKHLLSRADVQEITRAEYGKATAYNTTWKP